jgi:uncharacterized membrane protein YfcA
MFSAKTVLLAALVALAVWFVATAWRWIARGSEPRSPSPLGIAIGFVTNFFDTLGIGSFATTTSLYKLWGLVRDEKIPGTLNAGHTLPTVAQALIYITIVEVDFPTLVLMIAGSVLGSWLGAGVVVSWPRRKVQVGMGSALLAAAALMLMGQLEIVLAGGEALGLSGPKLALGFAGNFVLGALMSLGIGLYAPCLILISLLGMNPKAAFPIMMGSCAFLMPVASQRFLRSGRADVKAGLGLAFGGVPAVLIAAYLVGSMSLRTVRWLVIVVVVYTAAMMLRSAAQELGRSERREAPARSA